MPWAFRNNQVQNEIQNKVPSLICQEFAICGPEKKTCVANQTLNDKSCLVSCDGLYADIEDDSLKQNVVKGR